MKLDHQLEYSIVWWYNNEHLDIRKCKLPVKVAGYQRGVAEVGYKTARRLENESKLDEAELAYTENGGIQRSDC